MGRHYRRGHYRRGKNGRRVWVRGHSVNRYSSPSSWSITPRTRYSVSSAVPQKEIEPALPENDDFYVFRQLFPPGALTSRQLPTIGTPNSKCPVCGAPVWFIKGRYGGSVYLNEIGFPWTKHPCMVGRSEYAHSPKVLREVKAAYSTYRMLAKADKPGFSGETGCLIIFILVVIGMYLMVAEFYS